MNNKNIENMNETEKTRITKGLDDSIKKMDLAEKRIKQLLKEEGKGRTFQDAMSEALKKMKKETGFVLGKTRPKK